MVAVKQEFLVPAPSLKKAKAAAPVSSPNKACAVKSTVAMVDGRAPATPQTAKMPPPSPKIIMAPPPQPKQMSPTTSVAALPLNASIPKCAPPKAPPKTSPPMSPVESPPAPKPAPTVTMTPPPKALVVPKQTPSPPVRPKANAYADDTHAKDAPCCKSELLGKVKPSTNLKPTIKPTCKKELPMSREDHPHPVAPAKANPPVPVKASPPPAPSPTHSESLDLPTMEGLLVDAKALAATLPGPHPEQPNALAPSSAESNAQPVEPAPVQPDMLTLEESIRARIEKMDEITFGKTIKQVKCHPLFEAYEKHRATEIFGVGIDEPIPEFAHDEPDEELVSWYLWLEERERLEPGSRAAYPVVEPAPAEPEATDAMPLPKATEAPSVPPPAEPNATKPTSAEPEIAEAATKPMPAKAAELTEPEQPMTTMPAEVEPFIPFSEEDVVAVHDPSTVIALSNGTLTHSETANSANSTVLSAARAAARPSILKSNPPRPIPSEPASGQQTKSVKSDESTKSTPKAAPSNPASLHPASSAPEQAVASAGNIHVTAPVSWYI